MRAAARHFVVLVSVVLALGAAGAARPAPAAAADPGGVPPTGIERPDLRTASSRTFQLADGRMVTQLFDKPIFYQPDGSSSWQPVDTRLSETTDRTSALSASHAPSRIAFDAAGSAAGFLRLRGGGHAINIGLPTALRAGRLSSMPQSQEDGSYAEYANFLAGGVDLRVFPETDGYSMFLVLASRPTVNSYSFTIDAPGLALGPDPLGTPDALAFTDASGNVVGEMPRPFMQDSSYVEGLGSGLYSEAVSMSYSGSNGHWLLTLSIDPAFLDGATYPVYVDPSVTSFPNQDATAQDTFASSKYPGSNFNTYHRPDDPGYHEMWLGNEPGTNYYNQVFMRFQDLDTVLGDVDIDSAYLEFYPYWQYWHSDPRQSQMKRITSSWQQNQLTWNNRPTVETNAYMTLYTTQGSFSHTDVTQYVQDVVDGTWVDHGLQLNADSMGQGGWKRIVSLDDSHTSLLPHLDVTWHAAYTPVATPTWPDEDQVDERDLNWSYDDGDGNQSTVGTQAAFRIQVSSSDVYDVAHIVADSGETSGADATWDIPDSVTLTDGATYHWRVEASNGAAWSAWANTTFVWATTLVESTGIDPDSGETLTSEQKGYTDAYKQSRLDEVGEVMVLDPTGVNSTDITCCEGGGGYTIPTSDSLNRSFTIFHQQESNTCVPAVIESLANYLRQYDGWSGGDTVSGIADKQDYLKGLLITERNSDPLAPRHDDQFGSNGVGTEYGLSVMNNLPGAKHVYVDDSPSGSVALSDDIKSTIAGYDAPVFVEVNLRSTQWFWAIHPWKTARLTHATVVTAYYDGGQSFKMADPFLTSTTQRKWKTKPGYQWWKPWDYSALPSGAHGVVWTDPNISKSALNAVLARGYDTRHQRNYQPLWF